MNNKPQQRKNQRKYKVDRDYVYRKTREVALKCGWKILDGYGREYFVCPREGWICAPTYGKLHILKPTPNGEGYPTVKLKGLDGKYHTESVHRIIGKVSFPDFYEKPIVHHINHDKTDNRRENLMMAMPKENCNW